MIRKNVTIRDIAREAGVSINTVSRALNNKPDVNEKTRKIILNIAKKMGYVKNINASSLRSKKTHIVGVIIADSSNPFYAEVLKGIEAASRKYGYQIILMNTERSYSNEERAIEILLQRRVDGLLITPVQDRNDDIIELKNSEIPFVVVGRHFDDLEIDEIFSDEIKGGYLATKYLLDKGRKNILMLNGFLFKSAARMRLEGYKKALKEYDIEFNEEYMIATDIDVEDGFREIIKVFEKGLKIDGVVCYNDLMAYGVLKALNNLGLKVPDDIGVVGFDDIYFSSLVCPSLTTVKIRKFEMGYEAFKMLLQRMKNRRKKRKIKILDVELVVRNSA
ncbi:MAG: LacI family DNA-binding transcriptional regulator [Thermosipho sp. (in: Bacteria)]|nr:LacI family DNA-binding transcriptional regulator [Thermosipho sp. (in: thermotogales)]